MISAGRVLIIPRGEYDATTSYSPLDLVSYNGSSYIAKQNTTGNLPTNTTYWQLSAYGGSAANLAANFATLEITDYASKSYAIDDFLVTNDNQFCKVIANIALGDELVLDTNIEATDVGTVIQAVISYVAGLDANNAKLRGEAAISVQTDLNNLTTPGNYFKSATNIYVTNAPDGISGESTAIFRLTVENGSDTTNKLLQTLVTNDGETYKRGFNGSAWSDWIHFADAADVEDIADEVSAEIQTLTNEVDTIVNDLSVKNIFDIEKWLTTSGLTYTKNGDTYTTSTGGTSYSSPFSFADADIDIVISGILTNITSGYARIEVLNSSDNVVATINEGTTFASGKGCKVRLNYSTAGNFSIEKPMIRPASIKNSDYVPYAMTNRDLMPTLLWSNSAPTSDFAGQSVTLSQPFTDFKFLEIFYAQSNSTYQGSVKVLSKSGGNSVLKDIILTDTIVQLRTRSANPNATNKITFGDGYLWSLNSGATGGTVRNDMCVPLEVYGIK